MSRATTDIVSNDLGITSVYNKLLHSQLVQALCSVNIDLLASLPQSMNSQSENDSVYASLQTNRMTNDSRNITKNDIFCAVKGHDNDGRNFINKAVTQGASVIFRQCDTRAEHGALIIREASQFVVRDNIKEHASGFASHIIIVDIYALNEQLFTLTEAYYQTPQAKMNVVGITGTNGKTSTANIVAQLLKQCERKVAVIGTIGQGIYPQLTPIQNTTPGATELFEIIRQFEQQNVTDIAMEVSSHALDQKRVLPELFTVGVFTNLSRDHLDYHETMAAYAEAKFSLFDSSAAQHIVINGDDKYAQTWLANSTERTNTILANGNSVIVFGKNSMISQQYPHGYVVANQLKHHASGLSFYIKSHVGECQINSPLLGDFNVDNLLAAIAVLITQGVHLDSIQQAIETLTPITGRMETFTASNRPMAIVDYAHTPDGLKNALIATDKHTRSMINDSTLTNEKHSHGKLWVMFGCGGERDTGKRAEMGAIAEQYADHIVLTNDNPRSEAPQNIFNDILQGIQHPNKVTIVANRAQAIKSIFEQADKDDCILFAGKGHEEHILIGDAKEPYNERHFVQTFYQEAVS